jgi:S-DNA-T family DNA segregation ATPase FtsK/SpoIIIE
MSAVVDRWGWRARVGLPPGQTATDLINSTPALESGLSTRPGAVRVEPDPDRADHVVVRVLTTDPHTQPLPYPTQTGDTGRTVTAPIPLGLFEDAEPVTVRLAHRHGLLGGVAGAGKSGVLNVILAELVACPDVVLWGVDLKGGMELRPWADCLGRLATTPGEATALLADAVAILEVRARRLASDGSRLWMPTAAMPALIVVIDEYAELADESAIATSHADSIARRGRATAVTLLAATQRPTQKAMGSGAVRSQMDVRICLRVRERRDVDLILGQGMLAAGWAADTLNAPGKFLISTPEHATPRRARAYRVTDHDVAAIAVRHADGRPRLDAASLPPVDPPDGPADLDNLTGDSGDPEFVLWTAIENAPVEGSSVRDLMTATGKGRTWVYGRLQTLAADGRVTQLSRGRWIVAEPEKPR